MHRTAAFDETGAYRYLLTRDWATSDTAEPGRVCFVLLNPSIADTERDDPTIRRCIGFARRWGFGALDVVNLFAFRTPSPRLLRSAPDPIGPENDAYLRVSIERAALIVVGWGAHGSLHGRNAVVRPWLKTALCLGKTRTGEPRHPLYLRADAERLPF